MAITKTTEVERIEIIGEQISVWSVDCFDDPDDDQLPVKSGRAVRYIEKRTMTTDENGEVVYVDTDISGEDQLIQDIAAVVWA